MIYLDTSAVVKLVRSEAESEVLHDWLADQEDKVLVSSTLMEVEIQRTLRRTDPGRLVAVPTLIAKINRIEIDEIVRATAAAYPDPNLRTLDAIHLASAQILALEGLTVTAVVSYDKRLLASATAAGLPTAAPGVAGS